MSDARAPRRQFRLPQGDEEFLTGLGLAWETVVEAQLRWLLLRDFPISPGYDRNIADVAILIQPGYPPGLIDSAYVYPPLTRTDRRMIPNAQGQQNIEPTFGRRKGRRRDRAVRQASRKTPAPSSCALAAPGSLRPVRAADGNDGGMADRSDDSVAARGRPPRLQHREDS
jgi:hypothetical protein